MVAEKNLTEPLRRADVSVGRGALKRSATPYKPREQGLFSTDERVEEEESFVGSCFVSRATGEKELLRCGEEASDRSASSTYKFDRLATSEVGSDVSLCVVVLVDAFVRETDEELDMSVVVSANGFCEVNGRESGSSSGTDAIVEQEALDRLCVFARDERRERLLTLRSTTAEPQSRQERKKRHV